MGRYTIPAKVDDGHCIVSKFNQHYHTPGLLTEDIKEWYLKGGWAVSRYCQEPKGITGSKIDPLRRSPYHDVCC